MAATRTALDLIRHTRTIGTLSVLLWGGLGVLPNIRPEFAAAAPRRQIGVHRLARVPKPAGKASPSAADKAKEAERIAKDTEGVKLVRNLLKVKAA